MYMKNKSQNEQIGILMKDFAARVVNLYNQMETQPVCLSCFQRNFFSFRKPTNS